MVVSSIRRRELAVASKASASGIWAPRIQGVPRTLLKLTSMGIPLELTVVATPS